MEQWEEELETVCFQAPHWQKLMLQGFWQGLLSWLITCAEDGVNPKTAPLSTKELITLADPEFASWPSEYLESSRNRFMDLGLSSEQLHTWFERLHVIFEEAVPADLNIFQIWSEGQQLTEEQWDRLQDATAFVPPTASSSPKKNKQNKTRRIHGRRALTPIRARRATTRGHPKGAVSISHLTSTFKVVKLGH